MMKLASHMSFSMGEDYEKALAWAYNTGYTTRDFISRSVHILNQCMKNIALLMKKMNHMGNIIPYKEY
mgnify:CR=1 FL=1